jgi:hypothetical protein
MGEVAVSGALRREVDVCNEQILGVQGRWSVGDPGHGDRQLEQTLQHLRALDPCLLSGGRLEDLTRLGPSISSMNESLVPVIISALVAR